jgi:hypothetical protein
MLGLFFRIYHVILLVNVKFILIATFTEAIRSIIWY